MDTDGLDNDCDDDAEDTGEVVSSLKPCSL